MAYADPWEELEGVKAQPKRSAQEGEITENDAIRISKIVEAYDDKSTIQRTPNDESARSPTILTLWINYMSKVARVVPLYDLHSDPEGDTETNINAVIDRFLSGEIDILPALTREGSPAGRPAARASPAAP